MIETLLALGLTLTASTQLRASGVPIGPGELLLVVWLGLATTRQILFRRLALNPAVRRVALFWAIIAVTLCVGMLVGLIVEPFQDYVGMLRDAAAYILAASTSIMLALSLDGATERKRVAWRLLILGSISLLLQVADGYGLLPGSPLEPWDWDRLRGWAENPNQLGFFALIIVILGVHIAETARTGAEGALALALLVPPCVAGFMSHSDSFVVGTLLSGSLYIALKSAIWVRDDEMAPTLRGGAVVIGILALPLAVAAVSPFATAALDKIEATSETVYGENEQGDTRIHLWAEALGKGVDSKLIGFGPGPHLTSKSFKLPPPNKFEAHNTILDLLTQGGLVAVAAFIWLTGSVLFRAAAAQRPAIAALIVGLLVFSMFHYTLRHPIFWFGVVFGLLEAQARWAPRGAAIAAR